MDLLSILYQNFRGLKTEMMEVLNSVLTSNFEIICLCETWLDDFVMSLEIIRLYRDMSYYFKNKYNKANSGAVLIAVKKNLLCTEKIQWRSSLENIRISTIYLQYMNFCSSLRVVRVHCCYGRITRRLLLAILPLPDID